MLYETFVRTKDGALHEDEYAARKYMAEKVVAQLNTLAGNLSGQGIPATMVARLLRELPDPGHAKAYAKDFVVLLADLQELTEKYPH